MDVQCPGYRNLDDVLFRDESERIIGKAHRIEQSQQILANSARPPVGSGRGSGSEPLTSPVFPPSIPYPLSQPINELGANFFFAKYTFNEPLFQEYHDWLTQSYSEDGQVLQAAIKAVGMAGIANVSYAPHIASKSKEQYCKALAGMNQLLRDPVRAVADTTLMAVILLALFEVSRSPRSNIKGYLPYLPPYV